MAEGETMGDSSESSGRMLHDYRLDDSRHTAPLSVALTGDTDSPVRTSVRSTLMPSFAIQRLVRG